VAGTPSQVIPHSKVRSTWCIHYYSAVNYKYGGLLITMVTGTKGTGYKANKIYKVSTHDAVW
jgi:hypothetical protein